ncbi:ABC transporter substrate-binding protein [Providencia sp. CRE-3FA-0001]|uniref:ABC transporter substrate-binding protein n=1 Tax=Providencia huashanensis TaxID=3037798 RepID=A0AA42FHT4_9GAMM|nr:MULTISPECIES: ABC transporter substrate-binding protein [Providencia]EJD6411035.1 ABC transporter substrate-binding protein [Providencia rettgeri]EJD6663562.1 ABC transporter substrate-binding protein [Providencia rettgeri]ELR5079456.1 ABC transporter substrate-binding protein [Providencia rettgeri]ELR5174569.1 ABC transporter substrate-binding protein [Providencia rettgeri]ELR5197181.1 ABC transporter substrate-binding protein [Providencia rettgeri]
MKKKIAIAIQAICFMGLSMGANAATDTQQPQTLRLAIGSEPTEGFDPMLGWSHGSYLLLHSPLLKQKADLSWHSYMLEKYEHSDDGKEWTLKLKDGLKFSDGSPLTAKDVVFTYNNAAASGGKVDMGNFAKAQEIDPSTVKITLSSPQSTFINVLGSLGIVSADKYDAKKYAHNPIGAGPYRLVNFQPGQQLIVERNPFYAGPKNDFDKMVFVFLNEDGAFAAAQSDELDIVRIPAAVASNAKDVKSMKLIERHSVENRGISFPIPPAGEKNASGDPIGNDITSDVAIRKAINYAIDRKLLADAVLEGFAIPAYTGVEGLPWNNPQSSFKDGDIEKAKSILEDAGWKINKDGLREKDGKVAKLTLWYASGDSTRRDLAQAVRASLKPIGIEMDLKSGSWETVEKYMHANPTLFGWGSLDPMELVHNYSSKAAGVGFYNAGYYKNPAVDKVIEEALRQPDQDAAIPFWQKVDWDGQTGTGIQGDAAWAWLMNVQHLYLLNNCVELGKGAPEIHGSWSVLNNVDDWAWTCK